MRVLLALLLLCTPASAGEFVSMIAAAAAATAKPAPAPTPPAPSGVCDNCNGTGKLGDGTVSVPCPVCGGDGRLDNDPPKAGGQAKKPEVTKAPPVISADSLPADAQPTPYAQVARGLNALSPKPSEVLVDFGCGPDARWLIEAVKYYGTEKAIGAEIVPEYAESARRCVEAAGFSDRIEIVTGDSTKLDIQADIGVAYLWPETLAALKPRIGKLTRFVSYAHEVPGRNSLMSVRRIGDIYLYERLTRQSAVAAEPVKTSVKRAVRVASYAVYNGRIYTSRRSCRCGMCQEINRQLAQPRFKYVTEPTAAPAKAQPAGRYVMVKTGCVNGVCRFKRVWQAY